MNTVKKRIWASLIAVFLIGGLLSLFVFGLFFSDDPKKIPTTLLEKPAPDFSLETLVGGRVSLSEMKGHPLVVNFWASWCIPCRTEAVELEKAWNEFGVGGLRIVGVVVSDTKANALKFTRDYSMTFPSAQDSEKGTLLLEYGVTGIPETFFISPAGIIEKKFYGVVTYEDIATFFNSYKL